MSGYFDEGYELTEADCWYQQLSMLCEEFKNTDRNDSSTFSNLMSKCDNLIEDVKLYKDQINIGGNYHDLMGSLTELKASIGDALYYIYNDAPSSDTSDEDDQYSGYDDEEPTFQKLHQKSKMYNKL